jgi:DNA end-binding protein Ku
MAHAIWKGSISFGLVEIPVGLYSAETGDELKLHMLDKRDHAPVGYNRVNKTTGEPVEWEQIVKGYELDDGRVVVLDDQELKNANPEATETVDIVQFVDGSEIDSVYFDRPYYLAPLSRGGKAYALLRETLRRSGKVGVARVVIRTRQYVAALVVRGPALVLNLLRYQHELRDPAELDLPGENLREVGVSDKELELAERLVEGMIAHFDPTQFRDDYREDLLALIQRKADTGVAEPSRAKPKEKAAGVVDIMELLRRSVQQGGEGEPKRGSHGKSRAANVDREAASGRRAAHRRPRSAAKK